MKTRLAIALAFVSLGACRTNLTPVYREQQEEKYRGEQHCTVREFASAADLPAGSKSMGWVFVPGEDGKDMEAQEALLKKICGMGGDAYTAPSWVRDEESGQLQLKANAWELP